MAAALPDAPASLAILAARSLGRSLADIDPADLVAALSMLPPALAQAVLPQFTPERVDSPARAAVSVLLQLCDVADVHDNRAALRTVLASMAEGGPDTLPGLRGFKCRASELSGEDARILALAAPELEEVAVTDSEDVSEAALLSLLDLLQQRLRRVDLSWVRAVSSAVLDAALSCPALESLSLAGCTSVASIAGSTRIPPGLRSLDLNHCKFLEEEALARILGAEGLLFRAHSLALGETEVSGRAIDDAAHAWALAAAAAAGAEPAAAHRPGDPLPQTQLRTLAISWCDRLDGADVERLCRASPLLETLQAKCIPSIDDALVLTLAARCPSMRSLNLDRCGPISDAGVAALVAGCPRITEANVSWSAVTDAGLAAMLRGWASLCRLEVAGCKALTAPGILSAVEGASRPPSDGAPHPALAPRLVLLDLAWVNAVSQAVVASLAALLPTTLIVDYYGEGH